MARSIPEARPSEDSCSQAELDVFDALKANLPDDWTFLHSLWMRTHGRKVDSEADFVVITPEAVLILEVKGGIVWRDQRGWHVSDYKGSSERPLAEGPFDQARGAMYAVKTHLENLDRQDLWNEHAWGYGVVLPGCRLEVPRADSQAAPEMLLDLLDFPGGIRQFIENLAQFWRERKDAKGRSVGLSAGRRREVAMALRPNFIKREGAGAASLRARGQIKRLTEAQYYALEVLEENPRVTVAGPAGSGKTIVALEAVKRAAARHEQVLFMCFNRNLGHYLKGAVALMNDRQYVTSGHFHEAVRVLAADVELPVPAATDEPAFGDFLQTLAIALIDSGRTFDFLVLDEAQDLLSADVIDFLDAILKGGIRGAGHWLLCLDAEQRLYSDRFDQQLLADLKGRCTTVPLKKIVRYTKFIDEFTKAVTGINTEFRSVVESETMPQAVWCGDSSEVPRKLRDQVNALIHDFRLASIPLSEIAVLALRKDAIPPEVFRPGFCSAAIGWLDSESAPTDMVRCCTIHGFKGLEAEAVVLIGFENLQTEEEIRAFYVGATRARAHLSMLLPKSLGPFMGVAMSKMVTAMDSHSRPDAAIA